MIRSLTLLAVLALTAGPALADDIPSTLAIDTSGALPPGLTLADVTGAEPARTAAKATNTVERVLTWNEEDGAHVAVFLVTSKTGQRDDTQYESRVLYVTTFSRRAGEYTRIQLIKEVVNPCELDLFAAFIPESIGLTNLDDDAQGELTFGYVAACMGGMDPRPMKVLMLEGKDKFALRGTQAIDAGAGLEGGDFRPDFKKAPPAFLAHAKQVWAKAQPR
jgi:hypothetical protein